MDSLKVSSNCTLLELKSVAGWAAPASAVGSNCTLLELKCLSWRGGGYGCAVLIVPYWN